MYQFIQIDDHFFSIADIIRIRFTSINVTVVVRSIDTTPGQEHDAVFTHSESFVFGADEIAYAALKAWASNRSLVLVSEEQAQAYRDKEAEIREWQRQALLAECKAMLHEAGITGYELIGSVNNGYRLVVNEYLVWYNVESDELVHAVHEYIQSVLQEGNDSL